MTNEMKLNTTVSEQKLKAPKKRRGSASLDKRKARSGYFFVLPFLVGFIAIYLPMIWDSIVYSFSHVTIVAGEGSVTEFVGWENYREALFVNPDFIKTLISGIKELAFDIPAIILFSLFLLIGLVGSQTLPALLGAEHYAHLKPFFDGMLYVCLAYIMINVGREFELDKTQ